MKKLHVNKIQTNKEVRCSFFFFFFLLHLSHFSCIKSWKKKLHVVNLIQSTVSRQTKKGQTWFSATVSSVLPIFSKSSSVADQTCSPVSWRSALIENETRSTWEVKTNNFIIYYEWINVLNISHTLYLNINTYKKPFPQPRGPKNSSVGRQTFLHTPLRLGHDQGKDAASFSTTVHDEKYCSTVQYQNYQSILSMEAKKCAE